MFKSIPFATLNDACFNRLLDAATGGGDNGPIRRRRTQFVNTLLPRAVEHARDEAVRDLQGVECIAAIFDAWTNRKRRCFAMFVQFLSRDAMSSCYSATLGERADQVISGGLD